MPDPRFILPPVAGLHRVAKLDDALTFPKPSVETEEVGAQTLGGFRRFEDPRGEFGVLYCASSDEAAFGDDIAQYRNRQVDAKRSLADVIADFVGIGPGPLDPTPGQLQPSYFDDRVLVRLMVLDGSRCVDLDDPQTHAHLNEVLAEVLAENDLPRIDRTVIMGPNRQVTGAIARYVFSLAQRPGYGDVIGLRYESRFASGWERWAIWGQEAIYVTDEPIRPVTRDNPGLRAAAEHLGIALPPSAG